MTSKTPTPDCINRIFMALQEVGHPDRLAAGSVVKPANLEEKGKEDFLSNSLKSWAVEMFSFLNLASVAATSQEIYLPVIIKNYVSNQKYDETTILF